MSNIAIITARGGSKRIPRKNIKEFCGKPIIAYSIEAALGSGIFDEVMVSTDDEEIASIAKEFGASVPFFRSSENSGDHAPTIEVVGEVLESYKASGKEFDYWCCLYPTAPFVTSVTLKDAFEALQKSGCDALIPVVRFSFPPQRCFVINDDKLSYKWPENEFARSQDLEPFYHDAGQFYMQRSSSIQKKKTLVPEETYAFVVDETQVQDIDNMDDWIIAELKYKRLTET
ncbi:MAG: pseudaminic acid cytidylyltransferase [Lachnospiraceae bacterium]|nr:pseudaminic acid cytidylyltransferase [Lachnospiraceae bacterium]